MMEMFVVEDGFIWRATGGVAREGECSDGIAVVAQISGNEVHALGLLLLEVVL